MKPKELKETEQNAKAVKQVASNKGGEPRSPMECNNAIPFRFKSKYKAQLICWEAYEKYPGTRNPPPFPHPGKMVNNMFQFGATILARWVANAIFRT